MTYNTKNLGKYLEIRTELLKQQQLNNITDKYVNLAVEAYGTLLGIRYNAPCRCDKSAYRHIFTVLEKAYAQYKDEESRNFPSVELTYKEVVKIAKKAGVKAHGKRNEILRRLEDAGIEIGD